MQMRDDHGQVFHGNASSFQLRTNLFVWLHGLFGDLPWNAWWKTAANIARVHEDWTGRMFDQKGIDRQWPSPVWVTQKSQNLHRKDWMARLALQVFDRDRAGGEGLDVHAGKIGANLLRMKQISRSRAEPIRVGQVQIRPVQAGRIQVEQAPCQPPQVEQPRDSRPQNQAVIENPETAALMFQAKSLEMLGVLIESERSLQQISDALGWPINTSKYQLERLCEAGLVTCTREEARAGRSIRFYRAIAAQFFVPYVLTPAMNPATLLEQEYAPKAKRFAHNLTSVALQAREAQGEFDWGVRFSLENGKIRQHAAMEEAAHWNFLADEDPALIDVWDEGLMLSREDAKALQHELCQLIGRYRTKTGNAAYTVRLGLTPEVDASRT